MSPDILVRLYMQSMYAKRSTNKTFALLLSFLRRAKFTIWREYLAKRLALTHYQTDCFAAVSVFCISIVMVMGPTPPGTGVI